MRLGCLGQILVSLLAAMRVGTESPPEEIEKPKRKHNHERVEFDYLDVAEIPLLLAAAKDNPRDYAILAVLAFLGLRSNELVMLDVSDVRWQTDELMVRHAKGGKQRLLPLSPVADPLRGWLEVRPAIESPVLFVSRQGRMSNRHLRSLVKGYGRTAGVGLRIKQGLHPHALRHTCATTMLKAKVDLRIIQTVLGHSSPSVTAFYAAVDLTQKREAVEAVQRAMSGASL